MKNANKTSSARSFLKVLKYLKIYRIHFALSTLFSACSVLLMMYLPILVGEAIDAAIDVGRVDFERISNILLKILISISITAVLQWLINVLNNKMAYEIMRSIRGEAFKKLQKLYDNMYDDTVAMRELIHDVVPTYKMPEEKK